MLLASLLEYEERRTVFSFAPFGGARAVEEQRCFRCVLWLGVVTRSRNYIHLARPFVRADIPAALIGRTEKKGRKLALLHLVQQERFILYHVDYDTDGVN